VAQRTDSSNIESEPSKRFIVRWDIEIWRFDTIAEVEAFTTLRADRKYTVYDGRMIIPTGGTA